MLRISLLLIATLTLLMACGQKHEAARRCVDETGKVAAESNCTNPPVAGAAHKYAWVYTPAGAANPN